MLRPKKSLGQHFLHDKNILRKIVSAVGPQADDAVIEIGPGTGALTGMLAGQCRLIAVEIDGRVIDQLRQTFGTTVEVIHSDIRRIDLSSLSLPPVVRVAGNIPYNITSDILFWVFEHRRHITDATLMMQSEVADRLVASPHTKAYGILSVCAQVYAEPRRMFRVSRSCFTPPPEVDSAVVQLRLKPGPPDSVENTFRRLVRGLFGKRRKTIRNGLRHMGYTHDALDLAASVLDLRPEALTPEEFVHLAELLKDTPADDGNMNNRPLRPV